ncbi:MAG: hypothetical protein H7832_01790 [Magnetococcus sp. DMHC-6]
MLESVPEQVSGALEQIRHRSSEELRTQFQLGHQHLENALDALGERFKTLIKQLATTSDLSEVMFKTFKEQEDLLLKVIENSRPDDLVSQLKALFSELMDRPANQIEESVRQLRDAQREQGQELTDRVLSAFSKQLHSTVNGLTGELAQLSKKIQEERLAMELVFRELLAGLSEASHQGGEQLAKQLEHALAGSELRQDTLLNALTQLSSQIRVDLDLMQDHLQKTGLDLTQTLESHAQKTTAQVHRNTTHTLQEVSSAWRQNLQESLDTLIHRLSDKEQLRDLELSKRLSQNGETLARRIRSALQEDLSLSAKNLSERVRESQEIQTQHSSALASQMLETMSGKVEESIGGVTDGLADLRKRFLDERQSIKKSMQDWIDHFKNTTHSDDNQMATKIQTVMDQMDSRHDGLVEALNHVSHNLSAEIEKLLDNLLSKEDQTNKDISQHIVGLGHLLEGVVTNASREQTVFIEMLGERLDTLRKRLKIK